MAEESFVEPKAVLSSVKSSSWKVFNFRVSGENCRNIHFNKALRDIQISITIKVNEQVEILTASNLCPLHALLQLGQQEVVIFAFASISCLLFALESK